MIQGPLLLPGQPNSEDLREAFTARFTSFRSGPMGLYILGVHTVNFDAELCRTSLDFIFIYINNAAAWHRLHLQNFPYALPRSFGFIGSLYWGFSTPLGFSLAMYEA